MKKRQGYVSNSSSCSFLIIGTDNKEMIEKLLKADPPNKESSWGGECRGEKITFIGGYPFREDVEQNSNEEPTCSSCDDAIDDDVKFCPNCGQMNSNVKNIDDDDYYEDPYFAGISIDESTLQTKSVNVKAKEFVKMIEEEFGLVISYKDFQLFYGECSSD